MKTVLLGTALSLCVLVANGCDRDRQGVSDSAINAEVHRQLGDAKLSDTVDTATAGGTVTLSGTVPDTATKMKAEDLAQRVAGVSRVNNNLRVTAAADAPRRPAVNLPPEPPADSNVPPQPEVR